MSTVLLHDERGGLPSASSLERLWLCPGSLNAERGLPEIPSEIGEEGTLLHAVMAGEASYDSLSLNQQIAIDRAREIEEKLVLDCLGVTDLLSDNIEVHNEERLWYQPDGIPQWSGRDDRVYVAKDLSKMIIIDFKFGYIPVERVSENLQLRAYAVLNWKKYGVSSIYVGVIQPRCEIHYELAHYAEHDLVRAEQEIKRIIGNTQRPNAIRVASEVACKYCKARTSCPEALKTIEALVPLQAVDIDKRIRGLAGDELSQVYSNWRKAKGIGEAVEAEVKKRLKEDPTSVPGCQLVANPSTREIENPVQAFQSLKEDLTPAEFMRACKVSVPSLEKLYADKHGLKGKSAKSAFGDKMSGIITLKPKADSVGRAAA